MKTYVQARLDRESQKALDQVIRQNGWSASQAVREGLRLLAVIYGGRRSRRIIGLGQFNSGIPDLASNKKHMEGFGR